MDDPRTAHTENDTHVLDRSQTEGAPSAASGWIPAAGVGVAPAPGVTGSTSAGDQPATASTSQPAAPGLPAAQAGTQTEELAPLGFAFEPPPPGDEPTAGGSPERRPRKVSAAVIAAILAAGLIGGGAGGLITNALNDDNSSSTVSSLNGAATSGDGSNSLSGADGSVSQVAAAVLPSVVSIEVSGQGGSGEGSGVIISSDGQILTNNHVVELAANGGQLQVTFNDGKTASAEILGRDPSSDLAVIKASDVSGLKPAKLGSSADLEVGQQVVAIGSPLGLQGTVTSGIVSALNRPVQTSSADTPGGQGDSAVFSAIQTDAAINPGNSGGPLVNMSGEVIGINSAIATLQGGGQQSGSIGVGFAIPIDKARTVATQLAKGQQPSRAFLGVTVQDTTGSTPGAEIATVQSGSPAADAGLKEGDVVTKVDDTSIDGADALVAAVRGEAAGTKVTVTYVRDGSTHTAEVTLGSQSSSE